MREPQTRVDERPVEQQVEIEASRTRPAAIAHSACAALDVIENLLDRLGRQARSRSQHEIQEVIAVETHRRITINPEASIDPMRPSSSAMRNRDMGLGIDVAPDPDKNVSRHSRREYARW